MRALMRSLAPDSFDDVAALVALYRPGPMAANMHNDYADRKNGRKPVTYLHPDAEEVLADTYGLMIFQESVMRVAQKFAGYSLADADNLRKACGKKIREMIQKEREGFVAGCEATGYGREIGTRWFDIIEPFADYAFPKAHAYGYGLVAYQTAYLKANYPVEYFAALLTSVKTNLDKAAVYLNECRQMGISVLVPDVNVSHSDFAAVIDETGGSAGSIPFGLSAVRNVGEGLVGLIVSERDANGPFADFYDFCNRVDLAVLNKRTIESLIKAGAFDSLGHPRQGLLYVYEQILDQTTARRRREAEGQFDLFSMLTDADESDSAAAPAEARLAIPDREFDKKQRLAFEKEMLGLYVSDHPLMGAEAALRRRTECSLVELEGVEDGTLRTVGGLVTNLQRKWTKKGDLMAVFVLEDLQSSIEVMVFPKTMQQFGHLLVDDAVVCVKARIDGREDTPKLMALELSVFEPITDAAPPVRIRMSPNALNEDLLGQLKGLLGEHQGESQVFLHLGDRQVLRLPDEFNVDSSNGLMAELRVLLGPAAVAV
jgi:DNA polymerase III subunit alpha